MYKHSRLISIISLLGVMVLISACNITSRSVTCPDWDLCDIKSTDPVTSSPLPATSSLAIPCNPGHSRTGGKNCQPNNSISDDFSPSINKKGCPGKPTDWTSLNADWVEARMCGGSLHVVLNSYRRWFHAEQGGFLYKTITGDFRITTLVKARSKNIPHEQPTGDTRFVGLTARANDNSSENYVHLVLGCNFGQKGCNNLVIEWKNTVNSVSEFGRSVPWSGNSTRLRICRIDDQFLYLKREASDSQWIQVHMEERSDLPDELQIGMNIYSTPNGPGASPDLKGVFSWFEYANPNEPGLGCFD